MKTYLALAASILLNVVLGLSVFALRSEQKLSEPSDKEPKSSSPLVTAFDQPGYVGPILPGDTPADKDAVLPEDRMESSERPMGGLNNVLVEESPNDEPRFDYVLTCCDSSNAFYSKSGRKVFIGGGHISVDGERFLSAYLCYVTRDGKKQTFDNCLERLIVSRSPREARIFD